MTIEDRPAEGPDQKGEFHRPSPMARRRLVRSALATPVVLSTLTSRPVLGGQHTGCTPSGQFSGVSSHSPEPETCSSFGQSRATWLSPTTAWPPAIVRGKLPKDDCKSREDGTLFNGTLGLASAFYRKGQSGKCVLGDLPGTLNKPATMLEVLNAPDSADFNMQLGRAVVISLLNAHQFSQTYPVKPSVIVDMFNAAYKNQPYYIGSTGSASWSRDQVLLYLKSLYPA